jgi:hypothetical protein
MKYSLREIEPVGFGQELGRVEAVTLIQSNYGSPGNLELVARAGDGLHFLALRA